MDWEAWFKKYDQCGVTLYFGGELWDAPDIEELYQAFKSRLIAEIVAQSPELMDFAELKDITK